MGAVKKVFSAVTGSGNKKKAAEAERQRAEAARLQTEAKAAKAAQDKRDFDARTASDRADKKAATTTATGVSDSVNTKRVTARKGRSGLVSRRGQNASETRSGVSVPR